jgi:hypothetical protein
LVVCGGAPCPTAMRYHPERRRLIIGVEELSLGRGGLAAGPIPSGCLRGRPRGRFCSTVTPLTKIWPPHTPQGSRRASAPTRHGDCIGQCRQWFFASSSSAGRSENHHLRSRCWHGSRMAHAPSAGRLAQAGGLGRSLIASPPSGCRPKPRRGPDARRGTPRRGRPSAESGSTSGRARVRPLDRPYRRRGPPVP